MISSTTLLNWADRLETASSSRFTIAREMRELVEAKGLIPKQTPQTTFKQFKELQLRYPNSKAVLLERQGAHLLTLDMQLPEGFNKKECLVYVYVPRGYPYEVPMHFYTERGVRLANGSMPEYSNEHTAIPQWEHIRVQWWGWQVLAWDARANTLKTYVSVIRHRFEIEARR